jgi:Kef-type K+ transport system membrane component KefB
MMPNLSFSNLVMVVAVAFIAPLLLGLVPRLRLPSVVLELLAGIVIGPSGLGWVRVDVPIQFMALIGLAFLLFIAGLEIEYNRLRGPLLRYTGLSFLVSLALSVAISAGLERTGLIQSALLVAVILTATSLGVVIATLRDANESGTDFGQLVIAGASIADFGAIILLSLFFSREMTGFGPQVVLLGSIVLVAAALVLALRRIERVHWFSATLLRLQDTTAQIRVRGAFLLLAIFVVLAERLGLEVILGAFMAGAILKLIDRDEHMTHPQFRHSLEAAGFGIFVPIFFVSSGLRFDLSALLADASSFLLVPIFFAALLIVRGLPALLYLPLVGRRHAAIAGLIQAISLSFIVTATQIGMELGVLRPGPAAALVAAGLLSVLILPTLSLTLLQSSAVVKRVKGDAN